MSNGLPAKSVIIKHKNSTVDNRRKEQNAQKKALLLSKIFLNCLVRLYKTIRRKKNIPTKFDSLMSNKTDITKINEILIDEFDNPVIKA
jgi:hypothetical protein